MDRPSDGVVSVSTLCLSSAHKYGKVNVVITHGHDYTIGHHPKSGKELWRIGDLNLRTNNRTLRFVASPVAHKGLVAAPSAKTEA